MISQAPADRPHLMIVDSFALLFRGFYALAANGNYMRTTYGLCTNGLYQFTRYLMDALRQFRPTHLVCAFDMGQSTFRNELYPDYKAHREAAPEELVPQFDKLKELVAAFDIPCAGREGYEADDVIGTLAARFSAQGVRVSILTGDGDTLQLIDRNTRVLLMKKGFGRYQPVDLDNLEEERGVRDPRQIIDLKALMGDPADNIPGCPGVGPKTALKLIREYGSVEGVYAHLADIKGKLRERLEAFEEQVFLSRNLATIRTDVDIALELAQCAIGWSRDKVVPVLEELEFTSLIRSLPKFDPAVS
jgi:5'-3' exonuclease